MIPNATEDQTVPFPIYKCDNCGHVNQGFNPFEEEAKQVINE
jgi:predicted nucleic acid-binding Zn ribbon protein